MRGGKRQRLKDARTELRAAKVVGDQVRTAVAQLLVAVPSMYVSAYVRVRVLISMVGGWGVLRLSLA